jgi:hypothetical protein
MTIHFKKWNPHARTWYIYCLTSDKSYLHDKCWALSHTCPLCGDTVPSIENLKYSHNGVSLLRLH